MNRRHFAKTLAATLGACAILRGSNLVAARQHSGGEASIDAAAFSGMRRYAGTPFGEIAYVERGRGPAALFLHAFLLNGFQWRGAIERLSPYRRCIAPDLMGMGYSRPAEGQALTPNDQMNMILALLDGLRTGPVDIVASDTGGGIAQLIAARHPQRVRSLLLATCDTEPDCPPPGLLPAIELARQGRFVAERPQLWLRDKDAARAPGALGRVFTYPEKLTDEVIETYLVPLVEHPDRTHAFLLALEPRWMSGIAASLGRLRAPARVVWGTGDTIFAPDMPDYLDRTLGNSLGVRRVQGAKLFFPEEYPEIIAEEARALWESGSS